MTFKQEFWKVQREMTDEALTDAHKVDDKRKPRRWRRWLAMLGFVVVSSTGFYGCWKTPTYHCSINMAYGYDCYEVPPNV